MYQIHDFVNMSSPLFQELAYLFREKLRKTKNSSFANDANRAVFLPLFHGSKIGYRGGFWPNIRLENTGEGRADLHSDKLFPVVLSCNLGKLTKKWRVFSMWRLLSLILLLMNVSNFGTVFAVGENGALFQNRPDNNVDYFRLFSLREDEIKAVEVYWGTTYGHKTLTTNEIHSLIRILNKVRKQDIEPFRGPSPKGGPRRMSLLLKSGENLSLTLNGDYIIYKGNQANQPEIREFMNQVMKPPH